jgi:hypothetical protein
MYVIGSFRAAAAMTTSEASIAIGASPVTSSATQFCVLPAVNSLIERPARSKRPSSSPMYSGHSGTPGPTLPIKIWNGGDFVRAAAGIGAVRKTSAMTNAIHVCIRIGTSGRALRE